MRAGAATGGERRGDSGCGKAWALAPATNATGGVLERGRVGLPAMPPGGSHELRLPTRAGGPPGPPPAATPPPLRAAVAAAAAAAAAA
jgi:hypothetical protein